MDVRQGVTRRPGAHEPRSSRTRYGQDVRPAWQRPVRPATNYVHGCGDTGAQDQVGATLPADRRPSSGAAVAARTTTRRCSNASRFCYGQLPSAQRREPGTKGSARGARMPSAGFADQQKPHQQAARGPSGARSARSGVCCDNVILHRGGPEGRACRSRQRGVTNPPAGRRDFCADRRAGRDRGGRGAEIVRDRAGRRDRQSRLSRTIRPPPGRRCRSMRHCCSPRRERPSRPRATQ